MKLALPQGASYKPHGFTLIEVMIALAILSIALAAAARASRVATESAEDTKLRTIANWVAQNRLAEVTALSRTRLPPTGESSGRATMANIEFTWQQKISNTPNKSFRKVDVSVLRPALQTDATNVLTTLTTFVSQDGTTP